MSDQEKSYRVIIAAASLLAAALAVLVFSSRGVLAQWHLNKDQAAIWDIVLKAIAGYLGITAALISALRYLDDKVNATKIASREARRDFSAKQQEVYFKLLDATSTVANEHVGSHDRRVAEKRFWRLYWGEIIMVEDGAVAKAVDLFSDALWEDPSNSVKMLNMSMDIARACRDSLGETWKVTQAEIPAITDDRSKRDTTKV